MSWFWVEVFMLTQKDLIGGRKWQAMVSKLVPICVIRMQDTPVVVSNVTAYSSRIDKILDAMIYCPGMEIRRGSNCFVHWTDPQKGLTWGLNFTCAHDGDYFVDLLHGKGKGILCRRTDTSVSDIHPQQQLPYRQSFCSSSSLSGRDETSLSVRFAIKTAASTGHSRHSTPISRNAPSSSANSLQFFLTGRRLSHWTVQSSLLQQNRLSIAKNMESNSTSSASSLETTTLKRSSMSLMNRPKSIDDSDSSSVSEGRWPVGDGRQNRQCQLFRLRPAESILPFKKWLSKGVALDDETWTQCSLELKGLGVFMAGQDEMDMLTCLATPMPEYPRRKHIFCISDGTGRAFLLQANDEVDLELWISRIHIATAFVIAKTTSWEVAVRFIRKELGRIGTKIDTATKMLRLFRLPSANSESLNQVDDWEDEIETLHLHQFSLRCYLAAIKGIDTPNCQRVLTAASTKTKTYLNGRGIFTLSAMHAYCLFKMNNASTRVEIRSPPFCSSQPVLLHIALPNDQTAIIPIDESDRVSVILDRVCSKVGLLVQRYFLLLQDVKTDARFVPDDDHVLLPMLSGVRRKTHLRERLLYHVHLSRSESSNFGLTVRANRQSDRLVARVTAVDDESPAHKKGLMIGDELLTIDGQSVRRQLTPSHVQRLLRYGTTLCLILRTKRTILPASLERLLTGISSENIHLSCSINDHHRTTMSASETTINAHSDLDALWFSDSCDGHEVKYRNTRPSADRQKYQRHCVSTIGISRNNDGSPTTSDFVQPINFDRPLSLASDRSSTSSTSRMSPSERLEKSLFELIETEKIYIDHLDRLLDLYLRPLKRNALFPLDEIERLLWSTQAIARFQRDFLEELQEAVEASRKNGSFATSEQLKNALLLVGGIFLNKSSKFKVYSSFCASHFRTLKLLQQEEKNEKLQNFLGDCNVQGQLACSFESYLIKPIQRVLQYPLFLQQLKSNTEQASPEHVQISHALIKLEQVAEYINEMQRVCEQHGALFTLIQDRNGRLMREKNLTFELGDLLMFGHVDWMNPNDESRRKSSPVECLCFVFKRVVVLVAQQERHGKGKKSKIFEVPLHRLIPIREIEVNGSDIGSTEDQFVWILIHMDNSKNVDTVYHFSSGRQDEKQQFLRAIGKASKESTVDICSKIEQNGCHQALIRLRPESHHSRESDGGYASNGEPRASTKI